MLFVSSVCAGRVSLRERLTPGPGGESHRWTANQCNEVCRAQPRGRAPRTGSNERSTAHLEPPLEETELIQRLVRTSWKSSGQGGGCADSVQKVLQFLQHDGYVETARAFAEEIQGQKKALNLTPAGKVEGSNITEDDDASNRQRFAEDKDANNRQRSYNPHSSLVAFTP